MTLLMLDKKSVESIDFSCSCGMLQEPFHWMWRTLGSGKMGVRWDPLPPAVYPINPWVPVLTLPVGSSQGPLRSQTHVLHPAAAFP